MLNYKNKKEKGGGVKLEKYHRTPSLNTTCHFCRLPPTGFDNLIACV